MGKSFEPFEPSIKTQFLDYLKDFKTQEGKRYQGQILFIKDLESEIQKTVSIAIPAGVPISGRVRVKHGILPFSNLDKLEKSIVISEGLNLKQKRILLESPYVKNEIAFCQKIFGRTPAIPDFVLTSAWVKIRALTSLNKKDLKDLVCVKLNYCQNKDKHLIKIIIGLADILGLGGYATISWLIGSGYFDKLCQCSKKRHTPKPPRDRGKISPKK